MHNSNELLGILGVMLIAVVLLVVLIFQSSAVASKSGRGVNLALVGLCMAAATIVDLLLCLSGLVALLIGPILAMMPNHSGVQAVSVTFAGLTIIAVSLYLASGIGKLWTNVKS